MRHYRYKRLSQLISLCDERPGTSPTWNGPTWKQYTASESALSKQNLDKKNSGLENSKCI